ncbi:lipoprotein insertase outer membrane protein LolB [Jeongeupia sp. USM3]|uniref:lipoprotein insertase outer membrane protein LolB n=1 Tax=Jeongeupia sp. USM3 TaxID=1906741 RepID=UPI00089DD9DB|nr:lipoprotein insertase outer membrane protein LolB [Jeongeupia sp. USM3]AOY01214.1 outer membrane lipoprotein LolB [Jeongeupia sp. USM3]
MRRIAVLLAAGALLAGCATPPPAPGELVALGRVSIKRPQGNDYANFVWTWHGAESRLDLNNPLGQTLAQLTLGPNGARYRAADGRALSAADADQLLQDGLGWTVPVNGLAYWLKGEADPASPASIRNTDGVRTIEQAGWRIELSDWRARGAGQPLPRRLHLTRPDLDLRIAISEWQP